MSDPGSASTLRGLVNTCTEVPTWRSVAVSGSALSRVAAIHMMRVAGAQPHYRRWQRYGDPLTVKQAPRYPTEAAREAARREDRRRWVAANPEAMNAARLAWRVANPERRREHRRAAKKRNPVANRSYVRARRARTKGLTVVPITAEQLRQRWAFYGGLCWICGSNKDIQIEHVKPLSKGGAHMLCNLRPACAECNARKGTRWPYAKEARAHELDGPLEPAGHDRA